MFKILFTTDHEIHGNGDGSPIKLLVETTARTLRLFNRYGAKLTILADAAEILKFKEYFAKTGNDIFHYNQVVEQLREAIRTGHDVQLHLHSSYCKAEYKNGKWAQDYSEYNLATLTAERIKKIIGEGKEFLESTLKPVDPNYRCTVFRAACWSMSPTRNIAAVLQQLGFTIDTSVFKWGKRDNGLVYFDYSDAWSDCIPWQFDVDNVCRPGSDSGIFEFPIYAEMRPICSFFSLNRLFRVVLSRQHNLLTEQAFTDAVSQATPHASPKVRKNIVNLLLKRQVRKMDYNQCSGPQLVRTLKRIERKYGTDKRTLPVVLIGHSKLFTRLNAQSLKSFLSFVKNNPARFEFGKFNDFDLHSFA